jgi:outer membrane protein OmpA-like peptidoglycan-associated protein
MNERPRARDLVDPPAPARPNSPGGPGDTGAPPLAKRPGIVAIAAGAALLAAMLLFVRVTVAGAGDRLRKPQAAAPAVAVADDSEEKYCTPAFKQVLQRVINACGLVGGEGRRGCQPTDVKTFASISDADFNALFTPLKDRGAVILFDEARDALDAGAVKLLEDRWLDRKGARYFFVVARASSTGSADMNRALSHKRANSVYLHLQEQFKDPDLDKEVGLLWLGEEFAQLPKEYCGWPSSRPDAPCTNDTVNRSAFASWVDCRL